jgi:hypothetical protein
MDDFRSISDFHYGVSRSLVIETSEIPNSEIPIAHLFGTFFGSLSVVRVLNLVQILPDHPMAVGDL